LSRLLYIIDGYNVLHAVFPGLAAADLAVRREWLIERAASLAALRGADVHVVFDVRGRTGVECEPVAGTPVEVCFAGGRYAADAFIARRIAEQPADVTVFVVSGDQEVQRTAARAGVHRVTPAELRRDLEGLDKEVKEVVANLEGSATMRSQLEDKVDVETLRKLERLRTEGIEPDGEESEPDGDV
jgi:predicted RNA-binding protein with PIN domain